MLRLLVASLSLAAAAPQASAGAKATIKSQPFSEAWLHDRAQRLAQSDYTAPADSRSAALAKMSYDDYRRIRFRPEASVWRGDELPFQVQLFHLGHLFTEPVSIYIVERGSARALDYSPKFFDYGGTQFSEPLPEGTGFAGFRVHHPLNRKDYFDEVLVFLGASYFRALGRGNVYGLSARGLAIDTAVPSGEIFPVFREFYLEKPRRGARHLVMHALLDSPNLTGAYRFDVTPGDNTEVRVNATLFPRRATERLGVAPLTSMYLFGENQRGSFDDYRPEVHDSDGLLVWFGNGERLWRPLQNPNRLEVSSFRAESLKGFGLLQRDRQQGHYQDLEATYERRPSVWVEPIDGFGSGSVFLVEIPSREEIHDNVVAFFTPDEKPKPGVPVRFAYRLLWGMAPTPATPAATTAATFTGSAWRVGVPAKEQPYDASARKFVIDFASSAPLKSADGLQAVVTAASGAAKDVRVQPQPVIGGYRVTFDFVPADAAPVELRCFVRRGETALTETWSYRFSPPREAATHQAHK